MKTSKSSMVPGFILIAIGSLLFVRRFDFFFIDWYQIYPLIFLIIGIFLIISFINNKNSAALFWGALATLFGLLFLLRNFEIIEYFYFNEIWPLFLIILGIAFCILFVFNPKDWGVLIPGSILLFLGLIFLFRNLQFYKAQQIIESYWPLILIFIGGGVIIATLRKKIN